MQDARARRHAALTQYARSGLQTGRTLLHRDVVSGQHAGVGFEHYVVPAGKHTPARMVVSIATSSPGEFHVHPESESTEIVKQLGMVDEFQAGETSFDRKYYFSGTTDEYVRTVFGVRKNMEALRAIFARGFDQLEKTDKNLAASGEGAHFLGVAELKSSVEQLAKFWLPPAVVGAEGKTFVGRRVLYAVRAAILVLIIIGAAGFYATNPLVDGWMAFAFALLPVLAVLCAAILVAGYFGLKGRSMATRAFIELLLGMPFWVVALVGALALANERFDRGNAEEHNVRLLKRYATSAKRGHFFHLEFESWRGRNRERLNNVPEEMYALAREGQIWHLRVRPGSLRQPWIESMKPRLN